MTTEINVNNVKKKNWAKIKKKKDFGGRGQSACHDTVGTYHWGHPMAINAAMSTLGAGHSLLGTGDRFQGGH